MAQIGANEDGALGPIAVVFAGLAPLAAFFAVGGARSLGHTGGPAHPGAVASLNHRSVRRTLQGPASIEDADGRASEVYLVALAGPGGFEHASGELERGALGGQPVQAGGDVGGAGAGAAGEGGAGAALPDAHAQSIWSEHLDELDVGAVGERRVVLDERSDLFEGNASDLRHEEDGVWITHGYESRRLVHVRHGGAQRERSLADLG